MNDVVLNEKSKSMLFAIEMVLSLYCDFIYQLSYAFHDKAVYLVEHDECVADVFNIQINDFVEDFEYYKKISGAMSVKLEEIDIVELMDKVMFAHKQAVKELVMKNIESNLHECEDGAEYWKLRIVNKVF